MHGRMVLIFALTLSTILVGMLRSSGVYAAVILSPTSGNSQVLFEGPEEISEFDHPWSTNVGLRTSFNGRLFGKTLSELGGSLFVTSLGNVNFSGNLSGNTPIPSGFDRISPLWDDYVYLPKKYFGNGPLPVNQILFHDSLNNYIGVTWKNVVLFAETEADEEWPKTDRTFQMLWFEGDTVLNGFQFHRDDIAFSYIANKAGTKDFGPMWSLIGLQSSTGVGDIFADPKRSGGSMYFREIDGDKMPWQAGQFFLFRPTSPGASTYSVTLQPIPDPPQVPLPGTGIIFTGLGLVVLVRKRIQAYRGSRSLFPQ